MTKKIDVWNITSDIILEVENHSEGIDEFMKSHVERVREWLKENVQVFPEPEKVMLSEFTVDWDAFDGTFLVSFDSTEAMQKFQFGLKLNGEVELYLPMFHSPLCAPASYAAVSITSATHLAILKGLHDTFPRLKAVGIDKETGEKININTPPENRIKKELLEQAKAKVGEKYSITIELNGM